MNESAFILVNHGLTLSLFEQPWLGAAFCRSMYKTKRDVDNHVAEINRKVPSEQERDLKAWTVAKLYFTVGEYDQAVKFLDRYDNVRKNSPHSFKLRGKIYEALASKSDDQHYKKLAVEAYKRSFELDLSQKDLILVVSNLLLDLPTEDPERTR